MGACQAKRVAENNVFESSYLDLSMSGRERFADPQWVLHEPAVIWACPGSVLVHPPALERAASWPAASSDTPCPPRSIVGPRKTSRSSHHGTELAETKDESPRVGVSQLHPDHAGSFVIHPFLGCPRCSLFGVLEGHGRCGKEVTLFVADSFTAMFEKALHAGLEPTEALTAAFIDTDVALVAERSIDSSQSGTTSTVSFVNGGVVYTASAVSGRRLLGC